MASFRTIKASPPHRPGGPETPSASVQGHYFGWEVLRRMQPPPIIPRRSPTDVTPDIILRAMRGEFNLPPKQPSTRAEGPNQRVLSEWELLKLKREQGKLEAKLERSRCKGKRKGHHI